MDAPPILPTHRPSSPQLPSGQPKRHGCLLTWLIIMLFADVMTIIGTLLAPAIDGLLKQTAQSANSAAALAMHPAPAWVNLAVIVLSVVDIIAILFIFRWKKWAFFASVAVSALLIVVNLAGGTSVINVVLYPISPILLYLTLKMGGPHNGWSRLN